jgi:hypothetical protein
MFARLALNVVMQNDGDFVDVILLHFKLGHNSYLSFTNSWYITIQTFYALHSTDTRYNHRPSGR